jgi:hypothetical protein
MRLGIEHDSTVRYLAPIPITAASLLTLYSIVFRAFQGAGGSGIYAMVTVIQPEMVPPEKWGNLMAVIAVVSVTLARLSSLRELAYSARREYIDDVLQYDIADYEYSRSMC